MCAVGIISTICLHQIVQCTGAVNVKQDKRRSEGMNELDRIVILEGLAYMYIYKCSDADDSHSEGYKQDSMIK